ncbi:hypothetical protein [Nonomuraea maheshkhaliensis]|uniref:hypothetical protein n=1 Tax=Nonomuraea maheshkhaliensis TaxID=419590 RepID=UPI0031F8E00E
MEAALAGLPDDGLVEIVWQNPQGHITSLTVDETDYPALPAMLAEVRAVLIPSCYEDERKPLPTSIYCAVVRNCNSVWWADIICYGADVADYVTREFYPLDEDQRAREDGIPVPVWNEFIS